MTTLAERTCEPCMGGIPPLHGEPLNRMLDELDGGWKLEDEHHIEKDFEFKDFKRAIDFVNSLAILAEAEGHHPDILISYSRVKIMLWTHKIDGLHENDFVLAAKIDKLLGQGE